MLINKQYMGDGVYVAYDGFALHLTAEDGIQITDSIVIEYDVWLRLEGYVAGLVAQRNEEEDTAQH